MMVGNGSPRKGYTNEEWQEDFKILKSKVQPVADEFMKETAEGYGDEKKDINFLNKCYNSFVNDTLTIIRGKVHNVAYCFTFAQVADILKYEYNRLVAEWSEEDEVFYLKLDKTIDK